MGALTNGFIIVDAVINGDSNGLSFARIVEETGLPKASVHRLLKELTSIGALNLDPASKRYRGGLRLARLGAHVLADFDLRKSVHPHLARLHDETGHVATLGILEGDTGIYIDKIEAADFGIRLHSEIGKRFPLHCTGMGKVLLAGADPATQKRLTGRRLESYTDHTITDARLLRKELATITKQGYAIDNEEITRGMMCTAAPISDHAGRTIGAMSCTFPRYVFEECGIEKELACIRRCAAAASGLG